nr:MAG TPA: hypothetical protein [Caudoviricetes sp.]
MRIVRGAGNGPCRVQIPASDANRCGGIGRRQPVHAHS